MKLKLVLGLGLTLLPLRAVFAQSSNIFNPCYTTEAMERGRARFSGMQSDGQFEKWLAPKVQQFKEAQKNNRKDPVIITLPVVVHVIHNGDALGTNENITDAQVLSQIQVFNDDFRRREGTPGYNENPDGADVGIEFCLAQTDPDGNPTTGINHINMSRANWNWTTMETILKPQTQWDPERYLNIWVANFGGDLTGVGGYAWLPSGSGLNGLDQSTAPFVTSEGLAIWYKVFGSSDYYPQGTYLTGRDKGRSATHEMGHFLGLRHIWGDGDSCDATDYCDDTPPATSLHTACTSVDSCPSDDKPDMIENQMDYTVDACRNVFTNDQKARMMTVLQNAPLRASLLASTVCNAPDLGINEDVLGSTKVFPNPANDILNISTAVHEGSYVVYNILGQQQLQGTFSGEAKSINVAVLAKGTYTITLKAEGKTKTVKFVKE